MEMEMKKFEKKYTNFKLKVFSYFLLIMKKLKKPNANKI